MSDTSKSITSAASEIDPVGMITRRWRLLAFGIFAGLTLSVLYFQTATRKYQSSVEVLVGQRSSEMTSRGTISGSNSSNEGIGEDQLATHMRLFVARKVLTRAIELGELDQFDSFVDVKDSGGSLVDHILENIEVERGGEGSAEDAMVLRVIYRAPNPNEAALILSAIYNSYKQYIDSQDQDSSKLAVELIEAARETHEVELIDADRAYREYVASVPALLEGDNVREVHKDRLKELEKELNEVRSALAESSSRLQVIKTSMSLNMVGGSDDMTYLALLSQKEVERLKFFLDISRGGAQSEAFQAEQPLRAEVAKAHYNKLLELIQKEKELSDTFGSGHPLVEAARQRTEITRRFIQANRPETDAREQKELDAGEMVGTYVKLLKNDISEFEKREEYLVEQSRKEMMLAKRVEADFMKVTSLKAQVERAQSRYDQVIERLQELNLSRSYAGFSTDLLASAEVAIRPVWPNLAIVLVLGLGGGMAFGLSLVLVAEILDTSFGSVEDLERAAKAPVIAHVPRVAIRDLRKASRQGSMMDPSLMTFHSPRSAESEIFRVGRTSLMVANRKESVQTIMVTSPQPGDGKSTTISNLAISFAQTGKRILLIDADMRRPVVAKLFGINREPGLSDFLQGTMPFVDTVVESEVPNLHVMPNGSPTSEPAELLESHQLMRLFREACEHYDLILVDAPPVLAVADPAIIAPYVDSVLLTVRVSKNGRSIVEDAVRALDDIQIEPTAVIVNGIDRNVRKSYAYGGYGRNQYGYVGHYREDYAAQEERAVRPAAIPPSHRSSLKSKNEQVLEEVIASGPRVDSAPQVNRTGRSQGRPVGLKAAMAPQASSVSPVVIPTSTVANGSPNDPMPLG